MKWYTLTTLIIMALLAGYVAGTIVSVEGIEPKTVEVVTEVPAELTGWELLTMAIIKTESDFNESAIGKTNDIGILQITPIYVKEVNSIMDTLAYTHTDAFDVEKSLEMFNLYQYAKNAEHDIEKAIRLHNPNGDVIGYTDKVLANFRYLSRMENVRSAVMSFR